MSTRTLATAWMREAPAGVDAAVLLDWARPWETRVGDDAFATALADLYSAVLGVGLGTGARAMHARLGGDAAAPRLKGLDTAEALWVTVAGILASRADRNPAPTTADAVRAWRARFDERLRGGPDVFDELLLQASGQAARVPAWTEAVAAFGDQLGGAGRWFGRGTGKQLETQAKVLEAAFVRVGQPLPDRMRPWARHLWVVAVVAGEILP